MLTNEEIDALIAVGLPLERQRTPAGPRWHVGLLGPFRTPEEAVIVAVGWLVKHQSTPFQEDDSDDPPGRFGSCLGREMYNAPGDEPGAMLCRENGGVTA